MGVKMMVEILYHIGLEVEVAMCAAILDTLNTDTDLAKHPHFDTREAHLLALEVHHFDSKLSYQ